MKKGHSGLWRVRGALLSGCAAAALGLPAATAFAQNNTADASEETRVGEIVVTAQHRTERLQDVPISAQVVGAEALAEQNLNSLVDLSQTVPSVHIAGTIGRSGELFIRGIGSGNNPSFDQSVSTFIDGIYHGRARTSAGTFLDIERIEILKGPQSTFFGANAIAGAFNIITARPGDAMSGWARALYGENGQYAVEGAVGGPMSESVGVRAAISFNGQEGWLRNVTTGDEAPLEDNVAARLTLTFTPAPDFDATLKVEGSANDNQTGMALQVTDCPPPSPYNVPRGFCINTIATGSPSGLDIDEYSSSPGEEVTLDTFESALTISAGDTRSRRSPAITTMITI